MANVQPCVSPVWDTGLAILALQEAAGDGDTPVVRAGLDWLAARQVLDGPGDWKRDHPDLPGGGWPFQYANDHYPDLDDTAVIAWAMYNTGDGATYGRAITRATNWLVGMQSSNGGIAAFDSDNNHEYLNEIPFADHGALLDPPTADVTARVITLVGLLQRPEDRPFIERAMAYLKREQEADGSWFGRWGTNYIYGTWSVLMALEALGEDMSQGWIQRARRLSERHAAHRRQLGRGQRQLLGSAARALRRLHQFSDRLGHARPDGGRRSRHARAGPRRGLADRRPGRRWGLARSGAHGTRLSACVLSEIPRLHALLPALGVGALPQSARRSGDRMSQRRASAEPMPVMYCAAGPSRPGRCRVLSLPVEHLGIIAALPGEARALARLRPRGRARLPGGAQLVLSGMGAERAAAAAATLADEGVSVLMSWGTAAAIAPGVDPGASGAGDPCARRRRPRVGYRRRLARTLAAALAPAHQVFEQRLVDTPELVVDAAAKRALYDAASAIACDMESAAIAKVAADRGLAFVSVRAIIDDASMALPPVARAAMDADGRLRPAALLAAMAGRPASMHVQLRALKNLAVAFRAARITLADVAKVVRGEVIGVTRALERALAAWVELMTRHAAWVVFVGIVITLAGAWYSATHLTMDTDDANLISSKVGLAPDPHRL